MARRKFVVIIKEETSSDISSFLEYVKQQKFGWWHWVSNVWLLTTHNPQIKAKHIRDAAKKIAVNKVVTVLEVESVTWATYRPSGEGDIAKWIKDYWSNS